MKDKLTIKNFAYIWLYMPELVDRYLELKRAEC